MSRLYMIRHGRPSATWGENADPDPGLDKRGEAQAEAAADALMALAPELRPARVYASPLRRCRETAQPFADRIGAQLVIDERFGEIPTPAALDLAQRSSWLKTAFEGRWAEIKGDIDYAGWARAVGEALIEVAPAAVFSHFVAINAAVSDATGEDRVMSFHPDHASMTAFDVEDGRLRLVQRGPEAATQVL